MTIGVCNCTFPRPGGCTACNPEGAWQRPQVLTWPLEPYQAPDSPDGHTLTTMPSPKPEGEAMRPEEV